MLLLLHMLLLQNLFLLQMLLLLLLLLQIILHFLLQMLLQILLLQNVLFLLQILLLLFFFLTVASIVFPRSYASDVTSGLSDCNDGPSEKSEKTAARRMAGKLSRRRARARLRITGVRCIRTSV